MRRREGALGETHRHRRLELGELDDLDLPGGTRGRLSRLPWGSGGGLRLGLLLGGGLDVLFRDPPAGAGALHAAQVHAVFFSEAPGDGGDFLPLAVLLLGGTANDIEGSLRGRTHLGSIVRTAVRVLFATGIGRGLGRGGDGLVGLSDMRLRLCGLWFRRLSGSRLGSLLRLGGFYLALWRPGLLRPPG